MFDQQQDLLCPELLLETKGYLNSVFSPYESEYHAQYSEARDYQPEALISKLCNVYDHLSYGYCSNCDETAFHSHSGNPLMGDEDPGSAGQSLKTAAIKSECSTHQNPPRQQVKNSNGFTMELETETQTHSEYSVQVQFTQPLLPLDNFKRKRIRPTAIKLPEILQQKRKSTNAAKCFIKIGLAALRQYALETDNKEYLDWIANYQSNHDGCPNTREDLKQLLCPNLGEGGATAGSSSYQNEDVIWKCYFAKSDAERNEEQRAETARRLLQRELGMNKGEFVLANKSISDYNRANYLYFMKVYQWRLNHQELVERLT